MKIQKAMAFLLAVMLVSCGTESGKFRLEGRLRNMNMAQFLVYSPDGAISGIDTIMVREGRFSYELDLQSEATLILIFPNFSEQPVFAQPGEKVTIKGDATHMKEMIIEGTDANEEMTTLRLKLNDVMPPDVPKTAMAFISDHPKSPASIYLLQRYFLFDKEANYRRAKQLVDHMLKENPDNGQLIILQKQLKGLQGAQLHSLMPKFEATDMKGRRVTDAQLHSKVNVVYTWATWNYQSCAMQNRLLKLKKQHGDALNIVGVNLDGSVQLCRQRVEKDSLKWPIVCDGAMWATPLLAKFSMADVPDNVIADKKGRVVARSVPVEKIEETIDKLLK